MHLLVAGADRVDAGKTTFSTGLIDRLGAIGYKPRAGNDYWFDHDDYRSAVTEGRLYGKDARRLAAASGRNLEPEAINPLHRLWRPSPEGGRGVVGAAHRQFVLDRVGGAFVVNEAAAVPESAREHLPLGDARRVADLDDLNAATAERYLPELSALAEEITDRDRAVVESYGDVARPLRDVAYDAVAVVEPSRARIYDGDRYATACEALGGAGGPRTGTLENAVEDVVGHLEPLATVGLAPLTGDERKDPAAVAEAYEVAYDALLAAAVE